LDIAFFIIAKNGSDVKMGRVGVAGTEVRSVLEAAEEHPNATCRTSVSVLVSQWFSR
jgi:hypothetical protein